MKYSEIIQRAVQITWRNKVLWVFGIALALFGGMQGGNSGGGFQYSFGSADMQRWSQGMPPDWNSVAAGILAIVGLVAVLALIWGIIGIIVRYTSVGALIGMTAEIEAGEKTSFGAGLRRGWRRLLRLFAINLVLGIIGFLVAIVMVLVFAALGIVIVLPGVAMIAAEGGLIALGVLWLVLLGIAWLGLLIAVAIVIGGAFSVVREYAFRACVLQEQGVFEALGAAYALFRERLKQSAAMWLLLAAVQIGLGVILLPFLLLIGAGAGMSISALALSSRSAWPALVIGAPLALVGGLALLVGGGIYTAFESVAWTLFFQALQPKVEVEPEPEPEA
jgi:hypothetical protein